MLEADSKRSSTPIAGGKKKHQDESARSDIGYCLALPICRDLEDMQAHTSFSNLDHLSVLYIRDYLKGEALLGPLKSTPVPHDPHCSNRAGINLERL